MFSGTLSTEEYHADDDERTRGILEHSSGSGNSSGSTQGGDEWRVR
jgi:hypothetical protein